MPVSVVIPLYNHEAYIAETLDSVLAQAGPSDEIIVVDDGSSDRGGEIARGILAGRDSARVLTQPNRGAHVAINTCIEHARSDWIAVLNSDDRFRPDKLRRCAEIASSDPSTSLIFGQVALVDQGGRSIEAGETVDWLARAQRFLAASDDLDLAMFNENFVVTTSNMVFRKALWSDVGGFQALRYCHDLDFYFAANRLGKAKFDQEFVHVDYRVHPTNTIKENLSRIRIEIACVLAEALTNNLLARRTDDLDRRMLALFSKAVSDKGFGNLLPFLMAKRSQFSSRRAFYEWAVGRPAVNEQLRTFLDRPPDASEFLDAADGASRRVDEGSRMLTRSGAAERIPVVVELSSFDRGGLEKVVLDTSLALRRHGFESIIVSCGDTGDLAEIARREGMAVHRLPDADREVGYAKLLRECRPQIAISHFSRVGYPVFKAAGIPNVTFIHNVYAFLNGSSLGNFKSDDQYVDRYISVSPKATAYATRRLGLREEKISTIPNGLMIEEHVDRARCAAPVTREQFGLAPNDYVFLNVASYNLHKGHYLMAAAMKLVLAKTDRVKILCIGNTIVPHHFDAFRRYLSECGLRLLSRSCPFPPNKRRLPASLLHRGVEYRDERSDVLPKADDYDGHRRRLRSYRERRYRNSSAERVRRNRGTPFLSSRRNGLRPPEFPHGCLLGGRHARI